MKQIIFVLIFIGHSIVYTFGQQKGIADQDPPFPWNWKEADQGPTSPTPQTAMSPAQILKSFGKKPIPISTQKAWRFPRWQESGFCCQSGCCSALNFAWSILWNGTSLDKSTLPNQWKGKWIIKSRRNLKST